MRKSSPFKKKMNTSSWGNLLEHEPATKVAMFQEATVSHRNRSTLCVNHTALSDTAIHMQ